MRLPIRLRSIRVRIVATFLAAFLALVGSQAYLVWQQGRVSDSMTLVTGTWSPLSKVAGQLERDRQRVERDVARLVRDEPRPAGGASSPMVVYTDQIRINIGEGRIHAREALRGDLPAAERAVLNRVLAHLDRIDSLFRDHQDRTDEVGTLLAAGQRERAQDVGQAMMRDGQRLREEIESLDRLVDAHIDQLHEETVDAQFRATAVAAALTGLAAVLAVVLVGVVLYALRPVSRLTTQVQRLAAGDYGGRVEVRGGDEIALLAGEFNAMVRALELRDRTLVERADELNRLSRYLASVLDSLEEALLVVEEGRVTLANPAAERVWSVLRGAPPPESLSRAVEAGGRHEVEGPGGTLHEVRAAPFGDSGVLVVAADVTELTRAQERLARSERLALVGQMLAQITHEVRNPLNALSLNAELLGDELSDLDPERRAEAWDFLATITSEIDRLTGITAHYLQLARRPPARREPTDLAALVEDAARLLAAELEQAGVELELRVGDLPDQLVDGNQLRQAVLNVVRNAVEAGGRRLVLSLSDDRDRVRLSLSDDGPGMKPAEIERACDPFWSTKTRGTGLGLAITKQILDDHDGAVEIYSAPAQGTTVTLVLPWSPTEARETDHVAEDPRRR